MIEKSLLYVTIIKETIISFQYYFIFTIKCDNYYRKRLNNGPPFLHACTLFMYEIHA